VLPGRSQPKYPSTYRFGPFAVQAACGELRKDGLRLRVQEQPFQVLLALLERPGEPVTRDELKQRLWPDGANVDFDHGINKAVNRLREILRDDAEKPRYVETLPLRGYRFIAALEPNPPAPAAPPAPIPTASAPPKSRRPLWLAILAVTLILALAAFFPRPAAPQPIRSLAVLPLANLSADGSQDFLSAGLTDQLIAEIARIETLRVISRSSVLRYQTSASRPSLPEIARTLNVDAVLEGSVQRNANRVVVSTRLVSARDDRHLWSKNYEQDLADILSLQSQVASDVAREVRGKLGSPSAKSSRRVDPRAYEHLLKARFFFDRPSQERLGKSIEYFRAALDVDPTFAAAHAGLAVAYNFNALFGYAPQEQALEFAHHEAERALALDPDLAEAHNVLAESLKNRDWNWPLAQTHYLRAIALNPSYSLAHTWYAECLSRMGRPDEALRYAERARILDPISTISNTAQCMLLYRARHYGAAIAACDRALELAPHPNAHWFRAHSLSQLTRHDEAVIAMRQAVALSAAPIFRAALAFTLARQGKTGEAELILRDLTALAAERKVSGVDLAMVHASLGRADASLQLLERAFAASDSRVQSPGPEFDSLKKATRYGALVERIRARGLAIRQ
jgi:TolB-like protein/DNA-binding winged helix-turn-helix (wHTH) protein